MDIRYRLRGFTREEHRYINSVLCDERGWAGLGYAFHCCNRGAIDVVIMKRTDSEIGTRFPRSDLQGLSVTNLLSTPIEIWINKKKLE